MSTIVPEGFQRALQQLRRMPWRDGLGVDEIGSPQRIAPYSIAIAAELGAEPDVLANGKLILLHDPAGNDSWGGAFRLVSYARAQVDLEMVTDPLLPEVAWTWFAEALDTHGATATNLAGTITASYGRSFGELADQPDRAEAEIRCSWTPRLDAGHSLEPHLHAWQELLGQIAGEPPLPAGVTMLRVR